MWRAKATAPGYLWPPLMQPERPTQPQRDDTRRHALNWFLGVAGLVGVGIITVWWILFRVGWAKLDGLWTAMPLAPVCGITAACWQLIRYTREYRDWLYAQAEGTPPIEPKRKETPPGGTWLRGGDGVIHRVELALSAEEIAQIKRVLLRDGSCSVRVLTPIVGERASAVRQELHRLGILAALKDRAATPLTPDGKKAIAQW